MSSTPAQRFVCPRCRGAFDEPSHYCRQCGADMTRASALEAAQSSPDLTDRRLSDSNRAWLGKIVDNRYRVIEVIGRGGMGVVYRVEHIRMGKLAAMKVLHRDLANDPDVVARFEREALAISRLTHPNTVQVFDFGTAQGALYLIMELVRGQDLARVIERDGPLSWPRAAPLLIQICGALQEAHELGVIHRDLKPENVLITRTTRGRDFAKVLDFGLAKLEQRGALAAHETERTAVVGTPYFMAPEQIRGDEVDPRTDIYSFGASMFELLTGQHLYSASTAVGVLTKHLTSDADAPSMRAPRQAIPPVVDQICLRALAREPSERWQTASELGEALEEAFRDTVGDATGQKPFRSYASHDEAATSDRHADSHLQLRRSDIDAYEASLKRRRVWGRLLAILLVGGAAAAIVWYVRLPPPAVTVEREPNDDPGHADRIAPNTQATGYLGQRRSELEGDRDVYRVGLSEGPHIITIAVSGLPNLDINLALADRDGSRPVLIDEGKLGDGEVMHRRAVNGPVAVTVGQTLPATQPRLPVENISDPYTLTVTEEPVTGGEREPNGTEPDATPLVAGEPMYGYLDTRDDVDLLRWDGPSGAYTATVHVDGLTVAWQVAGGVVRTAGTAAVELKRGDVVRITRGGEPPSKPNARWVLEVTPR